MSAKTDISIVNLFRALLWTLLAAVIIGLTRWAATNNKGCQVTDVVYKLEHFEEGSDLVSLDEIESRIVTAYDSELLGADVETLDLAGLESFLDQEPFITKSNAYLDRSHRLYIHLQQRVPHLRIIDRSGSNYYLDEHGVKLPLSRYFSARVPVVTGYIPDVQGWDTTNTVLHDVHAMIDMTNRDPLLSNWLESIHIDRHQELSLYGNVGRFSVILGKADHWEEKLITLKNFLKEGAGSLAWNSLESISLEFDGQVITKRKSEA